MRLPIPPLRHRGKKYSSNQRKQTIRRGREGDAFGIRVPFGQWARFCSGRSMSGFLHRPYRAPPFTTHSILGLTPQAISHHPFGVHEASIHSKGAWTFTGCDGKRAARRAAATTILLWAHSVRPYTGLQGIASEGRQECFGSAGIGALRRLPHSGKPLQRLRCGRWCDLGLRI